MGNHKCIQLRRSYFLSGHVTVTTIFFCHCISTTYHIFFLLFTYFFPLLHLLLLYFSFSDKYGRLSFDPDVVISRYWKYYIIITFNCVLPFFLLSSIVFVWLIFLLIGHPLSNFLILCSCLFFPKLLTIFFYLAFSTCLLPFLIWFWTSHFLFFILFYFFRTDLGLEMIFLFLQWNCIGKNIIQLLILFIFYFVSLLSFNLILYWDKSNFLFLFYFI